MLSHPRLGSWFFLGEILTDAELDIDVGPVRGTCGCCTRCLDACPTSAFEDAYVLDARRCISYLTIELRGPIPRALRPSIGNWIFGCDVCNDVCPYNRRAAARAGGRAATPDRQWAAPRLLDLIGLGEQEFRARFEGTALTRAKRRGFVRNVCVALGNWGSRSAVAPLARALHDEEPLVRGHAAWALGRLGGSAARDALDLARRRESDAWVRDEIVAALGD